MGLYIMNPEVREDIDTVKEVCRYCGRYLRGGRTVNPSQPLLRSLGYEPD